MDNQNSSNSTSTPPQVDIVQADVVQEDTIQHPADMAQAEDTIQQPAASQPEDYIENTGGSVIDLLEDVNENDDFIQVIAQEMRLDSEQVKAILTPLLDKIQQGQITMEELALIMTAPIVDELPE